MNALDGRGPSRLRTWAFVGLCIALLLGATLLGARLDDERASFVLWQLRVPRVLMGTLVGATLGIAGAAFQILFANPLATPDTVGTTAGATLGALLALGLDLGGSVALPSSTVAAFGGALAASFIVAAISSSGRARMSDVLLGGIAVALAATALSTGITYVSDSRALLAGARWSLGQLPQVGYQGVAIVGPGAAICAATLLACRRGLSSFALGEELAQAQGVNVPRLRALVLVSSSLGVATCVAWCGPIAFVGLIVPHLVRPVLGASPARLLPGSLLGGSAFLVACDALTRLIAPTRELPVGVLTAGLGAPALILLIARSRRN